MKCRRCGAVLLDTDTFCVKCGQKVGEPMFCSCCGEQLRDGERFCHKCGSPVETEEIPISQQKTVDIPFDQIEQGILMEAEQAIVKRPGTEKTERRNPESYRRPGTEMSGGYGRPGEPSGSYRSPQEPSGGYKNPEEPSESRGLSSRRAAEGYWEAENYRPEPGRDTAYYEVFEEEERYEPPVRRTRRAPQPERYEEDYEDYEDYDDDEEEDSGDSKMKIVTAILGIIVIAIALAIGFILWQRNNPSRYDRPDSETEQEEGEVQEEDGDDGEESAGDAQGRIQILSNVNVRTAPTTEGSEVLMVAKQGETYEYYELVDDAWYHIKLEDGRDGYVSGKYVEDLG